MKILCSNFNCKQIKNVLSILYPILMGFNCFQGFTWNRLYFNETRIVQEYILGLEIQLKWKIFLLYDHFLEMIRL
ncbi:hypothetical protein FGO68_gene8304 [Halteria grandinella]|uniref:Uncharacterized protein n=1 Tax=Halteria grandinella TaxID=5974 RepID=A0A8J8NBB5_HALGN|nr:hypothetical protein FGO68_gene8304 [Halteria grandinella]